jgi:hypothetical protein
MPAVLDTLLALCCSCAEKANDSCICVETQATAQDGFEQCCPAVFIAAAPADTVNSPLPHLDGSCLLVAAPSCGHARDWSQDCAAKWV